MSEMIDILQANSEGANDYFKSLKERSGSTEEDANKVVQEILQNIKNGGDKAILDYTRKFDSEIITSLNVSKEEIGSAYAKVDVKFIDALKTAQKTLLNFMRNKGKKLGL